MVVDDDHLMIDLFESLSSFHDIDVVGRALDGDAAIEVYRALDPPPDVVLLDERMPNMSGIECMKEILKINPSAKIIFLSADAEAKDEAISEGARAFLIKPCKVSEIIETINRVYRD